MNRRWLILAAFVSVFFAITAGVLLWGGGEAPEKAAEAPPEIALVLDDFGYTKKNLEALKGIGVPVTMAVLPDAPYSKAVCSFAKENGLEVILHLPMEPLSETEYLEEGTITVDMADPDVKSRVNSAVRCVPGAGGVSNHMGSKATGDKRLMTVVMGCLKEENMFFLDSFTNADSVCGETAENIGMPCVRRDVFLDNEADIDHIRERMLETERIARKKGSAIAIGHDRAVTIEALNEIVPEMKEKGIKFVKLSEIIKK